MREKNHLKGLSSSYLNDNDDDEGYENSIAAIKADYNSKYRPVGSIFVLRGQNEKIYPRANHGLARGRKFCNLGCLELLKNASKLGTIIKIQS